jgi:hypothetical protein
MLKFMREHGYAFYLGASLGWFGHLTLTDSGWWAIAIPTIILVVISKETKK